MEMDPNPPSFNIPMSVQPLNLGEDYAKGMAAGQTAGEALGKGISSAFDVMNRNRTVDDTLTAMQQTGMLGKEQYDAVAGKSLGAKEAMLGMYAGQWIAQQAQNREVQKLGYQGNIDIAVSHAKLLDQLSANRVGGNPAAPAPAPAIRAQPNLPGGFVPRPSALAGTTQAPTPLAAGPDITRPLAAQGAINPQTGQPVGIPGTPPQMTRVGPPLETDQIPPGGVVRQIKGPKGDIVTGALMPDGTFRPRPTKKS